MHRKLKFLAALPLLVALALAAPSRAAAQNLAGVSGIVTDQHGAVLADYIVVIKSRDTGTIYSVKTDSKGAYRQIGLRPGIYDFSLRPKDKDQFIVSGLPFAMQMDPDNHFDIDLKKLLAAQSAEEESSRKKAEEDQKKFENMKSAYSAGQAKEDEADKARADMMKVPSAQRGALKDNVNGLYGQALQAFQQAQQTAPEKDPNLHLIYHQLGYTNEMLGNYDAAIAAYQKSVELKPTSADYLNSLSLAYAKAGKIPEATQACEKAAALDPAKAGAAWLNLGVVLYNANRLAEAVVPLQKATTTSPNNPDGWYLLGASLLATMGAKQEGEKMVYTPTPGTAEAYQKYLQLAPTGRYAADAKAALDALASLGAGVDTKVKAKKKP